MKRSSRVVLNVGGEIYETRLWTLQRFPYTILGNREKRMLHYCAVSEQYFFNRSRMFFDAILFFYQSDGILSCPHDIPLDLFEEECRFFELPDEAIKKMTTKYRRRRDIIEPEDEDEMTEDKQVQTIRSKLWDLLQNPETSGGAKIFSLFSISMILLAVVASCLKSVPSLQVKTVVYEENPWAINELVFNTWFLLELLLSALCAPSIKKFLLSAMTWIDIIAVVPYFIILSISKDKLQSLGFLRIVRLARITRMFRLSKHSSRMKLVGQILSSCMGQFNALLMCILLIVMLAGCLMYYLEHDGRNGSGFTSIPMGMYWAIQTVTTLGYGDIYPFEIGGKLVGGALMVFGAVTLTIPLLSIIMKFEANYKIFRQ